MAWAPLAFQIAGVAMSVIGSMNQASAQKKAAQQQEQAKAFEAAQLEQNAGQELAASQRRAMEERRRATVLASRALAVGSASGAGTSGNVEEIISDIAGEGAYRSALELYGGEDRARRLRMGAAGALYEGQSAGSYLRSQATGSLMSGLGRGAAGAFSLYSRYGQGGPGASSGGGYSGSYPDAGTSMDPRFA